MNITTDYNAYLECALWASVHFESEHDDQGTPFDEVDAPFNECAKKEMFAEFEDFCALANQELEKAGIEECPLDDSQVGHDFWLTRNGHGTGFWDRGIGKAGDILTECAKSYGSLDLYLGDDGEIYSQ